MKTDCSFSLAVSYFWLSDTCQGCSDWVSDTSGEIVKSCFQQRGEQGNSWKLVCCLVRSEPAHMSDSQQTAHTRPCCRGLGHSESSKVSASPTRKCSHKSFHFHIQEPGVRTWVWFGCRSAWALLRFQTHWTQGAELPLRVPAREVQLVHLRDWFYLV